MSWFRRSKHSEEQLSAYLDGELNARQASAIERHLADCVACSTLLEELRYAKSMLAALPRETPRRSFVLGPEHARQPAPSRAPRRPALTFAPAIALTVLVALLVVDLGSFTSNSASRPHDSGAVASKAAESQAVAGGAVTAPAVEGFVPETPNAGAGAASVPAPAPADATPLTTFAAPVAPNSALPPGVATPDLQAGSGVTSSGAADSVAAGPSFGAAQTPPVQPQVQPSNGSGSGSGPSTLRILEIIAGAAFLSSAFYVFAWPRLHSGGR